MAVTELTKDNLDALIRDSRIMLIDFWAAWCGPCRMFGPTFEAAADKKPDIVFAKCNTETQPEVAGMFGIRSIPTIAAFKEGIMVFMQSGALPAPALDDLIAKLEGLNMDEVREEMKKKSDAGK
jgi:thioredoxin